MVWKWSGLLTSIFTGIMVAVAMLGLCGCCCIPCIRGLAQRVIETGMTKVMAVRVEEMTPLLSRLAPLSDSLLPLSTTRGGLFTSCHLLPHGGEQSVLTHSTVRSISLAPVTHYPFPIYSGLCSLSVSVCLLWFVLPCLL